MTAKCYGDRMGETFAVRSSKVKPSSFILLVAVVS